MNDSVELVQLWEGGPYWADRNIGAENPWDSGYYFWWGDTIGYKRVNDKWVANDGSSDDFSFAEKNTQTHLMYDSELQCDGWITKEEDGVLVPEHDAATKHWGSEWRMPTIQELYDLCNKCDWERTVVNGISGYIVRGRGDYASESIFLPAAGHGRATSLDNIGSGGFYWSSVSGSDDFNACLLHFNSFGCGVDGDFGYRYDGQPVRAVQGFTE